MKTPNFFIVGAPKAGTTALYEYLRQHPDVFMSRQKELFFFGSDLHRIHSTPYTLDQYLSFFRDADAQARVGEASTSYLASRQAAQEIRQFCPSAKIIIMLRSPLDVMVAYHTEMSYGGFEEIADFGEALRAEPSRKHGQLWPRQPGIVENLFYREVVKFSEHVARYWSVFGKENTRIVIYDDFKRDTAAVYRHTLEFLGVDPAFQPRFDIVNANKRVRSPGLQRFVLHPPAFAAALAQTILPDRLRERVRARLRHLNTKQEPRPPLDPRLRQSLQEELTPEVERLSQLLGRDLSSWTRDAPRQGATMER